MNSKQYIPDVFHGKWRFPEKDEFRRQFREYQECMGHCTTMKINP